MKYLHYIILLLAVCAIQSRADLDSLVALLNEKSGSAKADLLNEISVVYRDQSPTMSLEYGRQAFEQAQQIDDEENQAVALHNMGVGYFLLNNYERAIEYSLRSLELKRKLDDPESIAHTLNNIGIYHHQLGNFGDALRYKLEALEIREKSGNRKSIAESYNNVGIVYGCLGNYDKALEYYNKSLELCEEGGDPKNMANTLNNIGLIHSKTGKYEQAINAYMKSLDIYQQIDDKRGIAGSYNNIGILHESLANYQRAIEYYQKALDEHKELDDKQGTAIALNNIGELFIKLNDYDKAMYYLQQGLDLSTEIGAKQLISSSYAYLAQLYEAKGDYRNALENCRLSATYSDSIYNYGKSKEIAEMEVRYETERREREIELLRKETKIQELELKKQTIIRNFLIILTLLTIVLAVVLFNRYLLRRKTAQILQEKNYELETANRNLQESTEDLRMALDNLSATQSQLIQSEKMAALGKLVGGIAHEINNPVGAVVSSSDVIDRAAKQFEHHLKKAKNIKSLLENVDFQKTLNILKQSNTTTSTSAHRIANMITSLKNFARLDESGYQKADLHEGLDSTLTIMMHELGDRITVNRNFGDIPRIFCNPSELNQVFLNLIQNAQKAISGVGSITIRTGRRENERVFISINDTGCGIPPDKLKTLFNFSFTMQASRVRRSFG